MNCRYTPEELERKIKEEDALIKELNANPVELVNKGKTPSDYYAEENTPYHIHEQKIKDAYWRRRNWIGYLQDPENYSPRQNPG